MKISTVDSQNFNGRAYVVGRNKRKELTRFANSLNRMKLLKNAECNIYLAYGYDFFAKGNMVKTYAKKGGFHWKADREKLFNDGKSAALNIEAVTSAAERVINSYMKRV